MKDFCGRQDVNIVTTDSASNSMVVYFTLIVHFKVVHVRRDQDVVEGLDQVEEQPDVDYLDIGGFGKVVADIDEHCSENQHRRHIQRYHSFKEELLEIVG